MIAERPEITVERFTKNWSESETDFDRLIPELISVSNETNRRPDTSHFEIKNGKLIDPDSKRAVLEFIAPGVEYDVAKEIEEWAEENKSGMAIWVSPKLKDVYPCNKALIYQIVKTPFSGKKVKYSAILFDGDISNPEDYRKTLLKFEDKDENLTEMISWIEEVSGQKLTNKSQEDLTKQARYFAQKIKAGADKKTVIREMQSSGFLGTNSISCPGGVSFSEYSVARGEVFIIGSEKYLMCFCPFCDPNREKGKVKAPISSGLIRCPRCNASAPYKC